MRGIDAAGHIIMRGSRYVCGLNAWCTCVPGIWGDGIVLLLPSGTLLLEVHGLDFERMQRRLSTRANRISIDERTLIGPCSDT